MKKILFVVMLPALLVAQRSQLEAIRPSPNRFPQRTGNVFPEWKGNLFVGSLAGTYLVRLVLDAQQHVIAEEMLLFDLKQRVRDVRQGPDGAVYLLAGNGLLRLTPKRP